tara:strand:- start:7631 stop:7768 length:138 start_codon:yes stop_codon:yes gene_type:complete
MKKNTLLISLKLVSMLKCSLVVAMWAGTIIAMDLLLEAYTKLPLG